MAVRMLLVRLEVHRLKGQPLVRCVFDNQKIQPLVRWAVHEQMMTMTRIA